MRCTTSLLIAAVALLLAACVLSPGKFESDLTIGQDRSFTFRYQGEVIAIDPTSAIENMPTTGGEKDSAALAAEKTEKATKEAERDAKYKAMVEAFSKERSAEQTSEPQSLKRHAYP